ncbi:amidohydrolase family protein [Parasphingopyxis sp. CP4]|uniref:Xaa-Pro dipeptidase n=1 Tax=Parasphingopyxis sp. CP4 TaxID=2724527 RepID=UPI0015A2BF01|nr:amidohydrolase family protein [Parasphingopyxis sp. CP4]QLC23231.1 amidohydrolase family protein [Parasphingopyxis sp. CP4]
MIFRIVAALSLFLAPLAAQAETLVVTADRMIDVLEGETIDNPVVVVTDGRITAVSSGALPADLAEDAERLDLPGMTLVPGLIDMHVHLTTTPRIGGYRRLEYTDSFWLTLGVPNARAMLESGFTTIRNVGASDYADVALRQGINSGFYPGPRIVAATRSFGVTGGHCDMNGLPPSLVLRDGERGVNGPEAVRLQVRQNRRYGADVIKICVTGGVFSRGTEVGMQQMSAEEVRAAVEEAHMLGMRVAAHAHGNAGIRTAIEAGVDTIEHASYLDDETIRMAIARGTFFSMDIYNTEYTLSEGEANGVLEENLAKERQVGTIQRQSFQRAVELGARHVFGSDAGVYPHGTGGRQFARMVRFGMTPLQAIQAATANAAEALDRTADVGAIAPGRYGDIIAVDGDPLTDITALEDVDVVIKGGDVVLDRR